MVWLYRGLGHYASEPAERLLDPDRSFTDGAALAGVDLGVAHSADLDCL